MASLERQAKKVVHFYVNFSACDKFETVKHFIKEGAKRSTVKTLLSDMNREEQLII